LQFTPHASVICEIVYGWVSVTTAVHRTKRVCASDNTGQKQVIHNFM